MDQPTHSPKFLRQRKFFLVLPILVLPFMTLIFWPSEVVKQVILAHKGRRKKDLTCSYQMPI
ncbi:hypothetical protein BH24BAC1_BH24BAC1_22370 [soil metagenome]